LIINLNNFFLFYFSILLVLSQTSWGRVAVFLSLPLLIMLAFRHSKIDSYCFKKTLFLNLVVFLGLISGLVHLVEYSEYYFARDIIYFIQAPIFIAIGVNLYREVEDVRKLLKIIVLTTFVVSFYKLIEVIESPSIILQSIMEIRYEYNLSNKAALLSFVILFYARRINFKLFNNNTELMLMLILLLSVVISFSRVFYLILLIVLLTFYFARKKLIIKIYGALIVFVLFVFFGANYIDTDGRSGDFTIESKVMHSVSEIIVKEYDTVFEIQNNWRGYEAYLGLSKYYEGNIAELVFGQGYGSVAITPQQWMNHGLDEGLGVLPIFHNGYVTILLKTGLAGLLSFFVFLYVLLKISIKNINTAKCEEELLSGHLLQASVFIIFLSSIVVHGIFYITPPVSLLVLVGVVLCLNNPKIKNGVQANEIIEKS
jgi:hypothetical protein